MAQNNMGAATQFPMLASGLTNTMPPQGGDDQQVMQMFQMLAQQAQNQQAPQMEQVPESPSPGHAFLAQLLGNLASSLTENRSFAQNTTNQLEGQVQAHDEAHQRNLQSMDQYDLRKQALLYDVAAKRVQYAIDKAKREDNQDAANQLAEIKGQVTLLGDEIRARAKFEAEHIKGQETRLTKQTQGAPNVNISHSTRDYTGLPGGNINVGGAGGGEGHPVHMTAEQIEKRADVVAKNLATNSLTKTLDSQKYLAALDSTRADLTKRYNPSISLIPPSNGAPPKHSVEQLDTYAKTFANGAKYGAMSKLEKIAAINKDIDGLQTMTPKAKGYVKSRVVGLLNGR